MNKEMMYLNTEMNLMKMEKRSNLEMIHLNKNELGNDIRKRI